jgi:hypothetical protein
MANQVYRIWKNGKSTIVGVTSKGEVVIPKGHVKPTGNDIVLDPENPIYQKGTPQGIRQESFEPPRQSANASSTKGKEEIPVWVNQSAENNTQDDYGPEGEILKNEDKRQGLVFRDRKWQSIGEDLLATPNRLSDSSSPSGFIDRVRKMVAGYRNVGENEFADALQNGANAVPSAEERIPDVKLGEKAARTLDVFRAKAQAFLPKWRRIVDDLGRAAGLSGEDIRNPDEIKGRGRSAEKYAKALQKGIEEPKEVLKDTLRASFVIETPEQGQRLRELLVQKFPRIIKEDNRFKNPLSNDYSDAILHFDLGNGLYAEIQVHVREMLDAKEISHLYYERQRTLKELGGKRTPEQDLEMERMDEAQKKLHAAASRAFTRRTNLSLETMWP